MPQPLALPLLLRLLGAPAVAGAVPAPVAPPIVSVAGDCARGEQTACLALARARTGVGMPVDLLAAKDAYDKACKAGSAEGCQGAQGIARYLGLHVELHFLSSVPRVWALAGPLRVGADGQPQDAAAGDAQAVAARLPFAERCYGTAMQDDLQLEGQIDMGLAVRGGKVTGVEVRQASLNSEDGVRCIAEELGRVHLPATSPDGEIFLRLRAEPAPAAPRSPPTLQDHLADGAQCTVGDPKVEGGEERLAIAATVAVRRAVAGTTCVLDEVEAGRWDPAALTIGFSMQPDGSTRDLRVKADPSDRRGLADCMGEQLQSLRVGETGDEHAVHAQVMMRMSPAWTATIVP